MSISDPIADALTSIRNASRISRESVDVPTSKLLISVLEVFKKENYIDNYRIIKDNKQGIVRIYLKYDENKKPAIANLKKVSKPGLRIYAKKGKIPWVLNGLGTAALSTSKGVMSDKEARNIGVGGEILCHIW